MNFFMIPNVRIRTHYFQRWIRGSGSNIPERWIRGSGSTSKWNPQCCFKSISDNLPPRKDEFLLPRPLTKPAALLFSSIVERSQAILSLHSAIQISWALRMAFRKGNVCLKCLVLHMYLLEETRSLEKGEYFVIGNNLDNTMQAW